jgi:hypothetical protein
MYPPRRRRWLPRDGRKTSGYSIRRLMVVSPATGSRLRHHRLGCRLSTEQEDEWQSRLARELRSRLDSPNRFPEFRVSGMNSSLPAVPARGLVKRFSETLAVDGIDLDVPRRAMRMESASQASLSLMMANRTSAPSTVARTTPTAASRSAQATRSRLPAECRRNWRSNGSMSRPAPIAWKFNLSNG